jgi:hypothetical protein
LSNHYFLNVYVNNFFGIEATKLVFFRQDYEKSFFKQTLESAGFDEKHQDYGNVLYMVQQAFTLGEIAEILRCLSAFEISEISVRSLRIPAPDQEVKYPNWNENHVIRIIKYTYSPYKKHSFPFMIQGHSTLAL